MEFILVLIGLVVVGLIVWAVVRYLHERQFTERGWTFDRDPGPSPAYGLNRPPFGRGRGRRVREVVRGTVDGTPFTAIRYESDTDVVPGYAVLMPLPASMPPFVHGTYGWLPSDARGVPVPTVAGLDALADDPAWGQAAVAATADAVGALTARGRASVSVDGATLVGFGCDDSADALAAFVPLMGRVAAALDTPALRAVPGPPVPPEMSLTDRPTWTYRPRDDAMVDRVDAQRGGYDHEGHDVLFLPLGPAEIGFISLRHEWKTNRTVTETDSNGNTRTRTETDRHEERIFELLLGFPFVDLTVNKFWDWGRDRVRFESEDFNRDFAVRCHDGKFASDVFHPRQMEYLQQMRPGAFVIRGGRMYVDHDGSWESVDAWLSFAYGFFGRVPEFVWKNLGARPPALMLRWEG